ncbi:unnamed protein product [Trichobilharzia regenti]|nr:unnamed protein product [Trichobilharzia regenti]
MNLVRVSISTRRTSKTSVDRVIRKKKCIRFLTDAEYEEDNNILPISPISSSSPNTAANSSKTTPTVAITAAATGAVNSTVTTQTNLPHYCPINQFPTSLPSTSSNGEVVSCLNMLSSGDPGSSLWTNYPPNILHHPLSLNNNNNNDSTRDDAINERLLTTYMSRNSHSIADLTTPTSTVSSMMTSVQIGDNDEDDGGDSCTAILKSNLLLLQDTFKPAKISPSTSPPLPVSLPSAASGGSLLSVPPIPTSLPQPPLPPPSPIHLPMSTSSEDVNYCGSSSTLLNTITNTTNERIMMKMAISNPSYNNYHEKYSKTTVISCSTSSTPSSSTTATTIGTHASSIVAGGSSSSRGSTVDIFCKPEGD